MFPGGWVPNSYFFLGSVNDQSFGVLEVESGSLLPRGSDLYPVNPF